MDGSAVSTSSRGSTLREDPVVRALALGGAAMLLTGGLVSSQPVGTATVSTASGVTVVAQAPRPGTVPVPYDAGSPSYDVAPTVTLEGRPRAHAATGRPVHLDIPALEVAADVVPVATTGSELVPPSDPQLLGWWADGAEPGALTGTALLSGHTVSTGGGALDLLHELRPADRLTVRTTEGRIHYEVVRVAVYSKPALSRAADRVFSQVVPGRLVLVTCTDYNGSEYLSNTVVVAAPTDGPGR